MKELSGRSAWCQFGHKKLRNAFGSALSPQYYKIITQKKKDNSNGRRSSAGSPVGWFIWVCLDQPASRSTAVLPESKPRACQPSVLCKTKYQSFNKKRIFFLKKPKNRADLINDTTYPYWALKAAIDSVDIWRFCSVSHEHSETGPGKNA